MIVIWVQGLGLGNWCVEAICSGFLSNVMDRFAAYSRITATMSYRSTSTVLFNTCFKQREKLCVNVVTFLFTVSLFLVIAPCS